MVWIKLPIQADSVWFSWMKLQNVTGLCSITESGATDWRSSKIEIFSHDFRGRHLLTPRYVTAHIPPPPQPDPHSGALTMWALKVATAAARREVMTINDGNQNVASSFDEARHKTSDTFPRLLLTNDENVFSTRFGVFFKKHHRWPTLLTERKKNQIPLCCYLFFFVVCLCHIELWKWWGRISACYDQYTDSTVTIQGADLRQEFDRWRVTFVSVMSACVPVHACTKSCTFAWFF